MLLPTVPPLEIVVYFEDKTGINLSVEDGQHADAGELFEIIMDEMSFPAVARDIFSLWLVSDLLGKLQSGFIQIPKCSLTFLNLNISFRYS